MTCNDHIWNMKSWDEDEIVVEKLLCSKCNKDFGGKNKIENKTRDVIHDMLNEYDFNVEADLGT